MKKQDFDLQLKAALADNRFTIDGDYVVFDKKSNLAYQVIPGFTLGNFLTANPISKTKINKNLLLSLAGLKGEVDYPLTIRSNYQSPEYALLSFGLSDSKLYETGDAVGIEVEANKLADLRTKIEALSFKGEVFYYPWGVHLGYTNKGDSVKDFTQDASFKQKVKNIISNDKLKNWLLIGAAGAAAWFFFIRKK